MVFQMLIDQFEPALICENGHLITDELFSKRNLLQEYCSQCGTKTHQQCKHCKEEIHGAFHDHAGNSFVLSGEPTIRIIRMNGIPNYCHACAKPYPWTEIRLHKLHNFVYAIESLTEAEKAELNSNLITLVNKESGENLAIHQIKIILSKAKKFVPEIMKDLVVGLISKSASASLFGI